MTKLVQRVDLIALFRDARFPISSCRRTMVRANLWFANGTASTWLAGNPIRPAGPDFCADRFRQNAGGVSCFAGCAVPRRRRGGIAGRNPSRLRLAAQSVEQRYSQKFARAAGWHSRVIGPKERRRDRCASRGSHWRYDCCPTTGADQKTAAHSRYNARVAVSAADVGFGPADVEHGANAHPG